MEKNVTQEEFKVQTDLITRLQKDIVELTATNAIVLNLASSILFDGISSGMLSEEYNKNTLGRTITAVEESLGLDLTGLREHLNGNIALAMENQTKLKNKLAEEEKNWKK